MTLADIRNKFPILSRKIGKHDLVYLDNAATTQKPVEVITAVREIYEQSNANIHRGNHYLSNYLTGAYEEARTKVKNFINASSEKEIVFTSGTTASINLLAYSFAEKFLKEGDEIITTQLEHHSNIVPWQIVCVRKNAILKHIPIKGEGSLGLDLLDSLITPKTKLVTLAHVANSTGAVNDIRKVIEIAHGKGIPVLVDAAQSIQHIPINVQELGCDFLVFSGHKIYGPTGIGVLYGKQSYLEELPPFMGGGEMIDRVTMEKTTYNRLPFKFEAGTPNYVGAIGLGVALEFVNKVGFDFIARHEAELYAKALDMLGRNKHIRLLGIDGTNISALSFVHDKIPSGDLGILLDKMGIAVRTGSHCAQPAMEFFGVSGTVRLSFAVYNTLEEIEVFAEALHRIEQMFI